MLDNPFVGKQVYTMLARLAYMLTLIKEFVSMEDAIHNLKITTSPPPKPPKRPTWTRREVARKAITRNNRLYDCIQRDRVDGNEVQTADSGCEDDQLVEKVAEAANLWRDEENYCKKNTMGLRRLGMRSEYLVIRGSL